MDPRACSFTRARRSSRAAGPIRDRAKSIWDSRTRVRSSRMKSVEELFSLTGRVAIVTGASRGLGKEAAEGLAEAGASVVLAARRAQWLEPTAQEFEERGFEILSCTCDIADQAQVNRVAAQTLERFGRIDILVNNAGVSWGG